MVIAGEAAVAWTKKPCPIGIIPSVISTYIVRRIGLSNMRRLFITGERISSEYAEKIGLIDFVFSEDEVERLKL